MERMSLDEFTTLARSILTEAKLTSEDPDMDGYHRSFKDGDFKGLMVSWSTGGASGGNCWNDNEPVAYTSDEEPRQLEGLDAILEKLAPTMTWFAYRRIQKQIETLSHQEYEYYGNFTNYQIIRISYAKLYEALVAEKVIEKR